jgi:hypothetical protein
VVDAVPFRLRGEIPGKDGGVPACYKIDKARKFVASAGSGHLTAAEILAHQQKLVQDPEFDPTFSQIFDFTAVTTYDISEDDVRVIAAITIFSPLSRRAALVTTDEQFDLACMFSMIREAQGEFGIRVFRERKDAMRWVRPAEAEGASGADGAATGT